MERAACALVFAFPVERIGDVQGVGIEFDHAVHGGAMLVERVDPRKVFLSDRARGEFSRCHAFLKFRDRCFVQFKRRGRVLPCRCECGEKHRRGSSQQTGLQEAPARRDGGLPESGMVLVQSWSPWRTGEL